MPIIRTYANKSYKESGAMQTLYFTPNQTKELLQIAGPAGLVLMQHYVAIAHQQHPNMEDEVLGEMLCMSAKNIEAIRLKLTKANWFKRSKFKRGDEIIITYDVGKAAVANAHHKAIAYLNTAE